MKREELVAFVMEHAESTADISWVGGALIGKAFTENVREAIDKKYGEKND